ncbi:short-chain dehydrogenase [Microthyrium microscopicum]|uniref:Short-chain dehydrogenase n=1 Tax=Microthyrium microscopicum TaxID=703497 RepID=A0A6A6UD41_9PEZI|nr:short-chain dehydrogenase [Microthyrium microscopicum]
MTSFGFDTTGEQVVQAFPSAVQGKTIIITGASNNSLGGETALALATASPAHLILLARTAPKVTPVIAKIASINPNIKITFIPVDLASLPSVRTAAATINDRVDKIDIVINNAAIMAVQEYTTNDAGIESQFATNHIGHFLFTKLLLPKLVKGGRVVNQTSNGYKIGPMRLDDYNFSDGAEYDGWSAYGQSKTANILFTRALAKRGVLSFATHPGAIFTTALGNHLDHETAFDPIADIAMRNSGYKFEMPPSKTAQQGSATALAAALNPELTDKSGSYMEDCQVEPLFEYASSVENAEKLWTLSEKLIGEKFTV